MLKEGQDAFQQRLHADITKKPGNLRIVLFEIRFFTESLAVNFR